MTKAGKCILKQHKPTLDEERFKGLIQSYISNKQRIYLLRIRGSNRNCKGTPIALRGDKIHLLTENLNVRYFRLKDIREIRVLSVKDAPTFSA